MRREFQAQSTTEAYMPHDRFGSNRSFAHKKFEVSLLTDFRCPAIRHDEQATQTQIPHCRSLLMSTAATPAYQECDWRLNPRVKTSRRGSHLLQHEPPPPHRHCESRRLKNALSP